MCDTLVHVTKDRVFFAKNSDREAGEKQILEWLPAVAVHSQKTLRCTWIEIEQVKETFATLLSRPKWMWGAEMGANECGVTIGNEAVFTKSKAGATGLTGMDLVRLGLERGRSAAHAVEVLTDLLTRYPQGGTCSQTRPNFRYFSSFLIADKTEAYVLETCDKQWAVERVSAGRRSISNGLTIKDFANQHNDFLNTHFSYSKRRRAQTSVCPREPSLENVCELLQSHANGKCIPDYSWINGAMNSVCMHAGAMIESAQTTGSWISVLSQNENTHWATATSAACLSLFKPFSVAHEFPMKGFAEESFWRSHERLHRQLFMRPPEIIASYRDELIALQRQVFQERDIHVAYEAEMQLKARWLDKLKAVPIDDQRPFYVRKFWKNLK